MYRHYAIVGTQDPAADSRRSAAHPEGSGVEHPAAWRLGNQVVAAGPARVEVDSALVRDHLGVLAGPPQRAAHSPNRPANPDTAARAVSSLVCP
jgi:hypothetical protein